jgi:outer membrane protein
MTSSTTFTFPAAPAILNSTRTPRPTHALAAATMMLFSALASAQTHEEPVQSGAAAGGIIGLGVASLPKYQGSDQSKVRAVPLLAYHWDNGMFVGGDNDAVIGYQVTDSTKLQYGVALSADEGRKERHASELAGMGDVATRAIVLGFAKGTITERLTVSSSVHLGAGDESKGVLAKFGVAYAIPLGTVAQLSLNMGTTLGNASYMQSFFGVSAAQAATSRYRAFTPSAGVRDASVGVRLSYQLDRDWSLLASWANTTLAGDAKDSPLVRKSSGQKIVFGAAYLLK